MAQSIVVVTGGSRGIGQAVCRRFASDGASVVAVARNADELAETRHLIEGENGTCLTHVADVGDPDEVQEMIASVRQRCGRIDVLVNNAGIAPRGDIEALDLTTFEIMMHVNVHGVFFACKAAWPVMRAQGGGVIVNLSSMAAFDPFPGFATYGASKAWVNAFTQGMAEEGRPSGIRVYAVAPGAVETQMLRGPFPEFPADKALDPTDVADLVHTLTRPECKYSSGEVVRIRK